MCSGNLCNLPAAPESKDLIAIIHPIQHIFSHPRSSSLTGRLHLSNRFANMTASHFEHASSSSASSTPGSSPELHPIDVLNVRIHKFGQPLMDEFENPVMHTFSLCTRTLTSTSQQLDLGVGEDGVIGRTVSITDLEGGVLGEGIIGRI